MNKEVIINAAEIDALLFCIDKLEELISAHHKRINNLNPDGTIKGAEMSEEEIFYQISGASRAMCTLRLSLLRFGEERSSATEYLRAQAAEAALIGRDFQKAATILNSIDMGQLSGEGECLASTIRTVLELREASQSNI